MTGQITEFENAKVPQMAGKALKNTKQEKNIFLFLLLQNFFFSKTIQGEFFLNIVSINLPDYF